MSFLFKLSRFRVVLGTTLLAAAAQVSAATIPTVPLPAIPPPSPSNAKSFVLMDFQTGHVIAESKPHLQLPPASLTKLMTAYLTYDALEHGTLSMDQPVHVSDVAWHTGGSRMFIQPAKPVTVNQLLHGLLIDSGNDAAVALAQTIGGSRASFVVQMNNAAKVLGLSDTHYANVGGLPDPTLHTSAMDVATLSRDLVLKYPGVINITKQKSYTYAGITQRSWNPALFHHSSVDGLKTGHTEEAGYCIDVTAVRNGRRLVVVVMGTPSWSAAVSDAMALLNYGYGYTVNHTLLHAGAKLGTYHNVALDPEQVPVTVDHDLVLTVLKHQAKDLHADIHYDANIGSKGIRKGQVLGKVTVTRGKQVVAEVPVRAAQAAQSAGFFGTWWNRMMQSL